MAATPHPAGARNAWIVTLAAAAILMVTMGARQSLGLFVSPLNGSTGLGITTISLALAVGQFMWGAVQPVAGAVADRYGPGKVLVAGLVVLSIGTALTPFMTSGFGLIVSLGLLAAIGSGAGSFSVLIGAASRQLTEDRRGKAAGIINAGGSFGQFVFAPISQGLIQALGWMGAMWSLAVITLGALPLARVVSPSLRLDAALMHRLFDEHKFVRVAHLAAEFHVDRSISDPEAFLQTNVLGTFTLLKAALDAWRGGNALQRALPPCLDRRGLWLARPV